MNIIKAISKNRLVILVTHEDELAKFYASRVIEMQDGKVINDYENKLANDLNYRLENKIYLKDFEKIDNLTKDNINVNIYSDNDEKIDLTIAVSNNNIYINIPNRRAEIVDENSAIELVNEHYKKIDKKIYEEYSYDLDKIIDKRFKIKYSSINGLPKSCYMRSKKDSKLFSIKKDIACADFLHQQCL